jgi:hypothetical protein
LNWLLTVTALVAALFGWLRARSVSRRLERLSESYWELKYENGQFKSRLVRVEEAAGVREPPGEAPPGAASIKTAFVPLSSLKK